MRHLSRYPVDSKFENDGQFVQQTLMHDEKSGYL